MQVKIDKKLCQGHGRCNSLAPEFFPLDDDGYIALETVDVPPGAENEAMRGVNSCPERAISVVD